MKNSCVLILALVFSLKISFAQQGKNGAETISATNVTINEYTNLTSDASAGSTSITVSNNILNAHNRFSSPLSAGDLILIIQMQGATIYGNPRADSTWGAIADYNNCGLNEFAQVASISGTTTINLQCPLQNNYSASGKVQVIRIPRYSSLTIDANDTLTCDAWDSTTGGFVAVEVSGNTIINAGGAINTTARGFRGGELQNNGNAIFGLAGFAYRFGDEDSAAYQGEGIAGYQNDYHIYGGAYGRGAAANAGGGGDQHNGGGGGGANAGNINGWTGDGNPDITTNSDYAEAWNLEYSGFANSTSSGGGKGGYTYSDNIANPLIYGPGNSVWEGDDRRNVGGKGGRPLDYSTGRLFLGGGGGAGHENNDTGGGGGAGGGLIYILSYGTISGNGSILSNGKNGHNNNSHNFSGDGSGGAGAGGTVILNSIGSITGISAYANGGNGGNQIIDYPDAPGEAEGPGGGGGGGYIAISNGSIITQTLGGANGTTDCSAYSAFPPNGATEGGAGITGAITPFCFLQRSAITGPIAVCPGSSITYSLPLSCSNTIYSWTLPAGWTGTSTTNSITVIAGSNSGAINVSISGGGCALDTASLDTFLQVTANPIPVVSIAPLSAAICTGRSVTLTANGASTYQWSPSTRLNATSGSAVTANPTATTTYTIYGTNSSGCSDTTNIIVTVNPLPVVSVTPPLSQICYGQYAPLTGSGASTYEWSPSSGLSATSGSPIEANPTITTSYTLIGTNSFGCSDSTKTTITVNPLPILTITPAAPQICIGQSTSLIVKGAATYHWSPSTGLTATSGSSTTATPTVTTTYTAYGTSFLGCNDSAKVTVKVNPLPVLIITPSDTALCRGYSASLTASGASTYKWSPSSGLSSVTNSTVIAKPTITTTYKLTGTSSSGCIDSTIIPIRVVQDSLKASITDTSVCQGNSAVLTASADYGYTWSPSTGLNQTTGSSVTATPTLTTSYTLIGTGPIGCLDTQKVVVNIYLPPVLAITPPSPQICIGHPVELNVSGASIYHWSPSSGLSLTTGSSVSANPVVLTTYTAYGTDVHGCNDSAKVSVIVNLLPIVTIAPLDSIVCNGLSVPLTVRGTSSYQWSPAAGLSSTTDSNVVAAPLATTTYTVYGTDNLGCVDTVSAIVKIIPNTIVITVIPTNSIICLGNAAFIEATGGTHYSWSPSVGINATTGDTLTANPISTTTYTVIGTGLGDCADTTVAIIVVSPPPVITVEPASPVMCYGQAMPLTASGAATYEWIPSTGLYETSGSAVDAHSVVTTNYTVYGTDSLFCNDSTKFTLTVKPSPVSSFTTAVPSICDPLQIQFSNTSTDGVSYFWNFGDGDTSTEQNPAHLFAKTGIYTITLISTSENGCMDTLITADTLTNGHSNLFVANSFTPSIQGMNQTFKPDIVCTAPSNYFLKIYDRWGVMLFESDDPTIGWDGTYKGKPQPLGSYVYYLSVNCGICTYSNKGGLTLIR